jgi:hypothetical protein
MSDELKNNQVESSDDVKNLAFWIVFGILLLVSIIVFALSGVKIIGWVILAVVFGVLFFIKDLFLDFNKMRTAIVWLAIIIILMLTYSFTAKELPKKAENPVKKEQNNGRAPNVDLGMFKGKTDAVGQISNKMPETAVTLKQITVGTKNFGKPVDGTWLITTFPDNNLNESKYIIEEYTIRAKKAFNLKDLSFNIRYEGGASGNGIVAPGGITPSGIKRFGFYQRGTSLPIKAGEVKTVKIFTKLTNQVLAANKIFIEVKQPNKAPGSEQNKGLFEITKYVK